MCYRSTEMPAEPESQILINLSNLMATKQLNRILMLRAENEYEPGKVFMT